MPSAINDVVLESPDNKVLDYNHPPLKPIAHQSFPKMVYLHPRDKTKEHRTLIVHDQVQLDAAEHKGYKLKPHVQEEVEPDLSADFEVEVKRGPGRPPKEQ